MGAELLQQLGYDFMAAAFAVYNELGNGYTEDIYQESLEQELSDRKIGFTPQPELVIYYRGRALRRTLRPDIVLQGDIIVELKAATVLMPEHEAQLLNYLKATGKPVRYLVNFGNREKLEWKRIIRTPKKISDN